MAVILASKGVLKRSFDFMTVSERYKTVIELSGLSLKGRTYYRTPMDPMFTALEKTGMR